MTKWAVIDALNGSLLDENYARTAAELGVTAVHITLNNYRQVMPYPTLHEALTDLALYRQKLQEMQAHVTPVLTVGDLDAAEAAGKLGIILGYQNLPGIGKAAELLSLFHALGVRIIQISHNDRNEAADGCSEPSNGGLSALGVRIVEEMNRLGLVIDLSHVGETSCLEVLRLSTQPVAITHANASALAPNARNKSDRVLDALKENGGVIGVTFLPPLVSPRGRDSTFDDVMAQIEYIAERIGVRHVGIGSDFIAGQPGQRYAEFLRRPDIYGEWPWRFPVLGFPELYDLFDVLLRRGYSESDVRGIAGDNFRRLFATVWK